jgi:hypothetical protein
MLCTIGASSASAGFITVYGGPTYDQTTKTGDLPLDSSAGNGVAVGSVEKYSGNTDLGTRAVRWDASGTAAIELGNPGTGGSGSANSRVFAINAAGTAVGWAEKYTGGMNLGPRAVRWDALGSAATELGSIGTASDGNIGRFALAINTAGVVVGIGSKYTGGIARGNRAVRWDASGNATELDALGTSGFNDSAAEGVNATGIAVGYSDKYSGNTYLGRFAVRWDASGTAATELGNLGTDSNGVASAYAIRINTAGTAIGFGSKYTAGTYVGQRAIRWDASGTAATELGNLGTYSDGSANTEAEAINTAGTAVGYADKYTGGTSVGTRAVRWDASGTDATELGNLGTDPSGFTYGLARALNTAGVAVGYAYKGTGDPNVDLHAVLWNSDGGAIDLNTLIDPAGGWTLTEADAISDTNWVTGIGSFDPDGAGPLDAYQRAFLLDVSSIVPEPAGLALLAVVGLALLRRQWRPAMCKNVKCPS